LTAEVTRFDAGRHAAQGHTLNAHATIYSEVSDDFINLVAKRTGASTVFAFIQELEASVAV
jgi:hypothetical protein